MAIPRPREVRVGGRTVGVYEYGDPAGRPVLTFHGVPASGAGFDWADAPARARGLRVLAPDRPGVGRSTAVDGWGVADYPAMVADLADVLELGRFAVWGYSGGGPYAVATAALLPDRVTATAIAAGMGQVGVWATADDFEKTDRQMIELSAKHPRLARLMMGITGRAARLAPGMAVRSFAKQVTGRDAEVFTALGSPAETMALFTEAFTNGARGVIDDYRAIGRPWDVDLDAVRGPVRIFQGTADTMVPLRHAEELARRLPGADLVTWPDEGHLGTIAHVDDILDWIAATA